MEYDIEASEEVSTAVIRAVSAVEGVKPESLRPLTEVIDPGAVNMLFDTQGDGTPRVGGRLSFVYSECEVTIDNGEYLTLRPIDPEAPDSGDSERTESSPE